MSLSLKKKDSILFDRLMLSLAISHYEQEDYKSALEIILKFQKVKEKTKSLGTRIRGFKYLGDIHLKMNQPDLALIEYKKVDSIAFKENYFFPTLRENYLPLIKYYEKQGNLKKQLFYTTRLLHVDSILDYDNAYLDNKIDSAYDRPNLLLEKQRIIDQMKSEKEQINILLLLLIVFVLGLSFLLFWYYSKQKLYKKRFHALLEKRSTPDESKFVVMVSKKLKEIDISENIINDVLDKLEVFEKKNGFLQIDLSLGNLAKQFDTNSKYFSKIINEYKGKSFTNYINDLRIEYAINELQNNPKIRKYTVKAIANEVGFNTTEAFSKSFYKTTGIYPSFFIKQLEKQYLTG